MRSYDIVVIGAGASGIMAAITAARLNKKVVLVEHLERIGKKILSTGNGKCNYTNRKQGDSFYRGKNPAFVVPVFEQFGFEQTIEFFKEIGIYPKEKNGYFYPYSEQAAAVVEVLKFELNRLGVTILTEADLNSITPKNGYVIRTTKGDFMVRKVIFATGLLAGNKTGCDGSAFPYIEELGHHFIDVVPALVQMKSKDSFLKELAGIRAEICLKMMVDGEMVFEDSGELQHIDGGISGIVSFQASRFASYGCKEGKHVEVWLDYFPKESIESLIKELQQRFSNSFSDKTASEAMVGLFPYKLGVAFLTRSNINPKAKKISKDEIIQLANNIKACKIEISGTKDYVNAQVCAGGVDTLEICNETLESNLCKDVYFCGELIDIDGMCGGYNLQWAWSSGYVAGMHAAK